MAKWFLALIESNRASGTTTALARYVPSGAIVVVHDRREALRFRDVLRGESRSVADVSPVSASEGAVPFPRGPLFFETNAIERLATEADNNAELAEKRARQVSALQDEVRATARMAKDLLDRIAVLQDALAVARRTAKREAKRAAARPTEAPAPEVETKA